MPHSPHIGRCLAAALTLVALVPAAFAASDTLYVNWQATGANNGTTWHDAYTDLQDALDFARASGGAIKEIDVALGTYRPDRGTGDQLASFQLVKGVKVLGGWWRYYEYQRDPYHRSTLSGDLYMSGYDPEMASIHVVTADATTDAETVLDGFAITGGEAISRGGNVIGPFGGGVAILGSPVVRNCVITGNRAAYGGGGLLCRNSQATIVDCIISDNEADRGGAAYLTGTPTFTNCTFSSNQATYAGGGVYADGAAAFADCTFRGNTAGSEGGGGAKCMAAANFVKCAFEANMTSGEGGGLLCQGGVTADKCSFYSNSAVLAGGGIRTTQPGSKFVRCGIAWNLCLAGAGIYSFGSTFISCCIAGNDASNGMYGVGGGAVSDDTTWASCLFNANTAGAIGGGLYCIGPTRLYGSTVLGNTAGDMGGVYNAGTQIVVDSSIIWGNEGGSLAQAAPYPSVTYSDIEGGFPGEGNIDVDPTYCLGGDSVIWSRSRCTDKGNPAYVPLPEETDMDGRARIVDGRIDMGADEHVAPIPGDVNWDGCCDVVDLLELYEVFGTNDGEPGYDYFCDLNEDGMIDVVDLLTMVENFGTCLE